MRPEPLLDKLTEGLKTLNIHAFPALFEPLFVPGDDLQPSTVRSMLVKPVILTPWQEELWQALLKFVDDSTAEG